MVVSMDRWKGKVAVVTGASAGIGAAVCLELVKHGLKVVALARRVERLEALQKEAQGPGELNIFQADVAKEEEIEAAFNFVRTKFGAIHVLVNNAGIARPGKVVTQDPNLLREVLNVNVIGLSLCTQQAYKLMKEANVDDGHIIHINSVVGHEVVSHGGDQISSMYSPSKFAVTALTEVLRQELRFFNSKIKVTSLSPGRVGTEFVQAALKGVGTELSPEMQEKFKENPVLGAQDIADALVYVLSTPAHVQIRELTIQPVGE